MGTFFEDFAMYGPDLDIPKSEILRILFGDIKIFLAAKSLENK